MGSSARKKKEKKKDFQKTKLKVGKTKAKADNFTDTSFKAKSIVVTQQSLTTAAPSSASQFSHYLSLASSRSDTQRRDALSYLTTQLASQPVNAPMPQPTAVILPKILPLILDGSAGVRTQVLKLFRLLPKEDIDGRAEKVLLYIRAGMTHLASEIRVDTLAVIEWLLEVAEDDAISCPGGWVKTLKCFMLMMGWSSSKTTTGWTSSSTSSFGKAGKTFPRQLVVFSKFLKAGLVDSDEEPVKLNRFGNFPFVDLGLNVIPTQPNAYAHLNLFGAPRDEEGEMYMEREGRQRVFKKLFQADLEKGIVNAKKEAGEAGRAAAVLDKIWREGMADYSGSGFDDTL